MDITTTFLSFVLLLTGALFGFFIAWLYLTWSFYRTSGKIRADAILKSKAVLRGLFTEQLAPILPGFPFRPSEVKFLGKPIDFVAFPGLDEDDPREIVFIEVKTGKAQATPREEKLKNIVTARKVRWIEYRNNNIFKEKEES